MFPLFQSKEKFSLGKFSASQFLPLGSFTLALKFLPFQICENISCLIFGINSCDVKFWCVDLNVDHRMYLSDVFKLFQTCTIVLCNLDML